MLLVTSSISGTLARRSSSFGTQTVNSSGFASSSTNWYCVRLTDASMVRSCTGCMNSEMPGTWAVLR